jgi:putative membrane protein
MEFIAHIVVTSILLFILGQLIDGFEVRDAKAAIFGAIVLGLANGLVRPILIFLTLPVTILTLGLFLLVLNALMLLLAAALVRGFEIKGFAPALWAAVGLAVLNFLVGVLF